MENDKNNAQGSDAPGANLEEMFKDFYGVTVEEAFSIVQHSLKQIGSTKDFSCTLMHMLANAVQPEDECNLTALGLSNAVRSIDACVSLVRLAVQNESKRSSNNSADYFVFKAGSAEEVINEVLGEINVRMSETDYTKGLLQLLGSYLNPSDTHNYSNEELGHIIWVINCFTEWMHLLDQALPLINKHFERAHIDQLGKLTLSKEPEAVAA